MPREGFWKWEKHPLLPMPVEGTPWEGQQEFTSALAGLQDAIVSGKLKGSDLFQRYSTYRGMSHCRLCNCRNGNGTFFYGDWEWPDGYIHYVVAHCVRPSLAFQEFILGKEL